MFRNISKRKQNAKIFSHGVVRRLAVLLGLARATACASHLLLRLFDTDQGS